MFHIVFELTSVLFTIRIGQLSHSIQLILTPLTSILLLIRPYKLTLAMIQIFFYLTFIWRTISILVFTLSVLHTIFKSTLVVGSILPLFFTCTVLQIVLPVADINLSVCCSIGSESMSHAFEPGTLIIVTIHLLKATLPTWLVVHPFTLIRVPITINFKTHTLPLTFDIYITGIEASSIMNQLELFHIF